MRAEDAPCAVIESPMVIKTDLSRANEAATLARKERISRRGIELLVKFHGKPPKSWMVLGCTIAVAKVPLVSQWAEIQRIARGFGRFAADLAPRFAKKHCPRWRSSGFRGRRRAPAFEPVYRLAGRLIVGSY